MFLCIDIYIIVTIFKNIYFHKVCIPQKETGGLRPFLLFTSAIFEYNKSLQFYRWL